MNSHCRSLAETHSSSMFYAQGPLAFHSRGPGAIVHLVVVYMCAFWCYFAARGSLRVGRYNAGEPTFCDFVTVGIQYVQARPNKQADRTRPSGAAVLCRSDDKAQPRSVLRRLQLAPSAPSTAHNRVAMRSSVDLADVPPPTRPHPALDVTFLYAPPPTVSTAHSSMAPAMLSPSGELSLAAGFNSSLPFNPSESAARGRNGQSAVTSSPVNGDLAYDLSSDDLRSQIQPNFFPFSRRIYFEGEAEHDSLPAQIEAFNVMENTHQDQNAKTHAHPQIPSLGSRQGPLFPQSQTWPRISGLEPVAPQSDQGPHPSRQNSFDNLTQAGGMHWSMDGQSPETAGGRSAAIPRKPSEYLDELAKAESPLVLYSPPRQVASPADVSARLHDSPTSMRVPADATAGVFPVLVGQLLPLLGPLLRLQVLAGRHSSFQTTSGEVSRTKEVLPFNPYAAAPVGPDQGSTLAPSRLFAAPLNPGFFSGSINSAGIVPFLSEILTGLPLSQGVLNLLYPSGQKLLLQADAHNVSPNSENYSTSTITSSEAGELLAGLRSGYRPAESELSAYTDSPHSVVKDPLILLSTAAGEAPLWHVGDKPLPTGSPLSPDKDSVQLASMLRSPLPRPNRGGNMTAPNFPPRPAQSIPVHALPTAHLRYTGNLDGDVADFFDSVIQRVWRTASGPSSFMRVPPPLYSHRAPEGVTQETAATLETGNQPVQHEGQEERERRATFVSREDESLRADSAEDTRQNEFGVSRWRARSRDAARSHDIPSGAASDTFPAAVQMKPGPLVLDGGKRTAGAKLSAPEEEESNFALEDDERSAVIYDPELCKMWTRRNVFRNNGAGPHDGADEKNLGWSLQGSSQEQSLSVTDGARSTLPSALISVTTGVTDSDAADDGDPDPAANIVDGWVRRNTPESFLRRRPAGCKEENNDGDADFPDALRCRTGMQRSRMALAPPPGLLPVRVETYPPLSVQQLETVEPHFLPPFQLPVSRRDDAYADLRQDSREENEKENVVWAGPDRLATSKGDTAQLLPTIPCSDYRVSLQAFSDYTGEALSLGFVTQDSVANRFPVPVESHRACISRTCLTTKGAGDQKQEQQHPYVLDHGKVSEPEQQRRIPYAPPALGEGLTQTMASPRSSGNDYVVLGQNTPSGVRGSSSDVPKASASKSIQFVNAQQTVDSPVSDGDYKTAAALTTESRYILEKSSSKTLPSNSPSESSSSPYVQPELNCRTRARILEDPQNERTHVGRDRDTAQESNKREYRKPRLPQEKPLNDSKNTLFWFREAQTRGRPDTLSHYDKYLSDWAASAASPASEEGTVEPFPAKQLNSVGAFSPNEDNSEFDHPWSGGDTEEDFFLAFNGFPEPYDYYFPLHYTEKDPSQQPVDDAEPAQQAKPPDREDGESRRRRHGEYPHSLFPAGGTILPPDALETYEGTTDDFFSFHVDPHGDTNSFEDRRHMLAGDEEASGSAKMQQPPEHKESDPAHQGSSSDGSAPFLSKLSSFFQTLPLAEWLRLDPTRVGPFDWKKVFGDMIPVGRRFKRAKEMAHDVILNEYCNRTASESSTGNNTATLGGFSVEHKIFPVPDRIQSDFRKCVEFYRLRTREYVEEYRSQCQEVWEDPRSPNYGGRNFVTVDDVADCLVQKYDVGRRWFNELFYQPWYRLMNQTSYLLQAVDTAFAEFHYDAWFFPAAYSAANFGLWRACSDVDDCFTGEMCVEALPRVYNFTLSFCHHTPESMNLDPITGMPLAGKFS